MIGRIGSKDAAIYETANGNKFIAFSLAADGRVKGKTVTSWYDIISFDIGKYERMLPYMTKGSSLVVVGELYAEVEKGNDGVVRCRRNVTADLIKFGPKSGNSSGVTTDENTVIARTSSETTAAPRTSSETTAAPRTAAKTRTTTKVSNDIPEDIPMGTIPSSQPEPVNIAEASPIDDLPF